MSAEFPIHLTDRGKGWRKTRKNVRLEYEDGTCLDTSVLGESHLERGNFTISGGSVNGYYAEPGSDKKIRVTNIAGGRDGRLLKVCPHCGEAKPLDEFDDSGRVTDDQRDQSQCSECRNRYYRER